MDAKTSRGERNKKSVSPLSTNTGAPLAPLLALIYPTNRLGCEEPDRSQVRVLVSVTPPSASYAGSVVHAKLRNITTWDKSQAPTENSIMTLGNDYWNNPNGYFMLTNGATMS